MTGIAYAFGPFVLDCDNRLLLREGEAVEVSSRYLDALILLVREPGGLVSKDRFLAEVWRGVPVTDEALTQCVKSLRRALGDDAARPVYIETVPKHGYRFVAVVEQFNPSPSGEGRSRKAAEGWGGSFAVPPPTPPLKGRGAAWLLLASAGVVGGGLAGLTGGLVYGFVGAGTVQAGQAGGASIVLVLTALCVLVSLVGAAGVSLGIALTESRGWMAQMGGGALGGMLVGGSAKLLGLDAFNLLVGASPGNITGALEGAVLGAAVGLGVWLGRNRESLTGSALPAAVTGALSGIVITASGGRMMAGSLDLLSRSLPQSRLRLDGLGALFGEQGLGPVAHVATGALEGGLFAAFISGAMALARRQMAA